MASYSFAGQSVILTYVCVHTQARQEPFFDLNKRQVFTKIVKLSLPSNRKENPNIPEIKEKQREKAV